jgi:tetratricopeptide (TPR) repeat protein
MTIVIAIIIVLAVGIGFLVFFVVKSLAVPKRVDALADLIKRGKTQIAIKAAKMMIAKNQRNAEAHYYLGKAYLAEGKTELALMELKAVNQIGIIGKDIPEADFRQNLAQLFVRYSQSEEALKEYLLLIKIQPDKGEYYYWAGKLFSERNRADMAENYLKKAAELSPRDGKIHYELGLMLYKDKKAGEAKAELEAALKYQQDNAQAHFYLGKLQKDSKNYQDALGSFEKAARDAQFKVRALVERGGCFMSLNAVDKAIPELERAVRAITDESGQDSLYARYFLAMCFEKTRDIDKAIVQWDKIYAQKKNFRDVGEKLTQYQEFRADDRMKDYLTSGQQEFLELCKAVATQSMDLNVKAVKSIPNGCDIIAMENDSAKWRNVRKTPRLIRFYRMPEMVDEAKIRTVLDDIKNQNMTRGVVVTSSGFSGSALEFANSRPVELYNKEKLQELLHAITGAGDSKRRS